MSRGTGASGRMRSNGRLKITVLSMLLLPALCGNASCHAQEKGNTVPETRPGREMIVKVQELIPVESDRKIRTTNLYLLFRIRTFDTTDFKFHVGLTLFPPSPQHTARGVGVKYLVAF